MHTHTQTGYAVYHILFVPKLEGPMDVIRIEGAFAFLDPTLVYACRCISFSASILHWCTHTCIYGSFITLSSSKPFQSFHPNNKPQAPFFVQNLLPPNPFPQTNQHRGVPFLPLLLLPELRPQVLRPRRVHPRLRHQAPQRYALTYINMCVSVRGCPLALFL